MRSAVDGLSVFYNDQLRAFMSDPEIFSNFIGNRSVGQKVQIVQCYRLFRMFHFLFKIFQYRSADKATCRMFKYGYFMMV